MGKCLLGSRNVLTGTYYPVYEIGDRMLSSWSFELRRSPDREEPSDGPDYERDYYDEERIPQSCETPI